MGDRRKGDRGSPKGPKRTQGINNKKLDKDDGPLLRKGGCEKVLKGENNTWIVLGRDRPGDVRSGYGGRATQQQAPLILSLAAMVIMPRRSQKSEEREQIQFLRGRSPKTYQIQTAPWKENLLLTQPEYISAKEPILMQILN